MVRQRVLVPSFAGSNPAGPAIIERNYMEDADEKDLQLLDEELSESDRDDGDMLACGD